MNITNIKYVKTNYVTIAESEGGPMLVQHINAVGTHFYIEKRYKDTTQLLTNFIEKSVNEIVNNGRTDMT